MMRQAALDRVVARLAAGTLAASVLAAAPCRAQDLEPRAYAASPAGAFFLVAGLSRSTGEVLTDPTLPVKNIDATIYGVPLAAGYTFGLFGRLALITTAIPASYAEVSGEVGEEARSITRTGLVDMRTKFSVNLTGNPAVGARAFIVSPRKVIIGTSLTVVAPTGQYKDTQLINLGAHRWAFKPELGVSVPKGHWDFDGYAGVWLFTANDDFYPGGRRRSQDAVVAIQGHTSYTFRPRLWVAIDATWYHGGSARIDGADPTGELNNSRIGATLSLPLAKSQSLKVAYSSGLAVRTGSNFRTLSVGWQWLKLTK
ncbi:transporter [Luteitalea pratensis]|nr:transporter [Luteitalea pratensis]